jgi:uncharacterized protein YukE
MSSLVQNILALESEASTVVTRAHEEAAALVKQASETIAAQRTALEEEMARRVEEFRKSAVERHENDLAAENAAHRIALDAIDQISTSRLQQQVDRIVNAFRGL